MRNERAARRTGYESKRGGAKRTSHDTFVEGNTVRKLNVVSMPQREPERAPKPKQGKQSRHQAKSGQVQEKHFGFGYVVVLAVCAAVTLWVCTGYLKMQAENTRKVKNIAALEKQLTALRTENDDEYNRLLSSVDLNKIRETAIEELGMVYANADQVVLYDSHTNDYVRQYGEIPQEETSILDSLLGSK
ncbi:MAG: hypothetical protein HFI33_02910 [Lachnospiraceae bacterium]|nr:hypothetical protein [Lachnospiraceae bacterium]